MQCPLSPWLKARLIAHPLLEETRTPWEKPETHLTPRSLNFRRLSFVRWRKSAWRPRNWILTGALRPADVGKPQSSQAETVFGRHHFCRRSSDQASRSLAAQLQGGAFDDAFARFLTIRAEHPNTQAWGRRKDVKVFGCSDDCARCGTAKTVCQLAKGFALDIPWSRGCERAENEQHYPADEGSAGGRS